MSRQEIGRSVFEWGKGEVPGLMVKIAKEGKGENIMRKSLAVVNMAAAWLLAWKGRQRVMC